MSYVCLKETCVHMSWLGASSTGGEASSTGGEETFTVSPPLQEAVNVVSARRLPPLQEATLQKPKHNSSDILCDKKHLFRSD